ncbi:AraC family transcriptional regulator [Cupriavidus basilensis]|uniref:AraC family transcriptional regulator n=1 Tax=Cupriavidus basilensis TaxID=68895 RepID=A0ABT6ATP1_9BURK|nr:AraC family transcriptional regulator [Cupriavidus basilensis]MDF3835996.1 AraC family transcriptional regulator [Cupriavidus basilensis]
MLQSICQPCGDTFGAQAAAYFGIQSAPELASLSASHRSEVAVAHVRSGPQHEGRKRVVPAAEAFVVAMHLEASLHHELWRGDKPLLRQGYARDAVLIVDLEDEVSVHVGAPLDCLLFHVPRMALDDYADECNARPIHRLACAAGHTDPTLAHLARALLPSLALPAQCQPRFVDTVLLAVLAHLAHTYGGLTVRAEARRGALSDAQEHRAKEYLAAASAQPVSLDEVAQACGLSRGHFAKAFKEKAGVTPHRWLQRYRVDRAKALMAEQEEMSLAQVAVEAGFADQSHLTRVFGRFVGIPPGTWRRERRS